METHDELLVLQSFLFGQVIIEAFQYWTPAIVRRLGAMTEVVEHGGGLAYATREELLAAMDRLLADSAYRDELGRRGYQAYRRYWTADAHLERYFALIDDLSRAKRPR